MQNLRELREISGLSQFAVAARARVVRMRLSLSECGVIELSPEETKRVRECLLGAMRERTAKLQMVLSSEVTAA